MSFSQHADYLGSVRAVVDFDGSLLETSDFLPYGTRWSQTVGSAAGTLADATNRWRYSGKEEQAAALNPALPLIDYGARMYDPVIARWMSVDPLAEKYYPMGGYGDCAGSPICLVDLDGRMAIYSDDVELSGPERNEAFIQLQSSVQGELLLSMDSDGKVSYTQVKEGKLSRNARQLINAIDDNAITVHINAANTTQTPSGNLFIGGAFLGNTVTENTIVAEQSVNPNVLGKISEAHDKPGADMLHEVTEAYQGALISQKKGVSSPASNQRARYIAVLTIERQNNPELYLRRFMTLPEKKGKCSQEEDIRQEPLVRNGSSKIRRAKKQ